ncbi:MAG: pilus assembly PilX N-terminal domain-containing protein [Desulfobacterales bacterium]|jgi:Tfp pilus assembly protein PilX|nr:pilus assembly PilX N-terminal domain-containing protein [Desulfobacterales bacterium]
MRVTVNPLSNQNGSIIVVTLIMLVLLTLIGISSTTTSTTEVQVAANNQSYQVEFYLADSGWHQGAMWIENRAAPPSWVNTDADDNTVKNFGADTGADVDASSLSGVAPDNSTLSQYDIPYWYKVAYLDPTFIKSGSTAPEGNEKGYERFFYEITSNANTAQQIQVRASKIFKVGY